MLHGKFLPALFRVMRARLDKWGEPMNSHYFKHNISNPSPCCTAESSVEGLLDHLLGD
ncbi:hypothetical protein M408DRAFT_334341 [Serendipita vermifera MAFF 305830]|uniref:Uncharacterized protein n=1 Tax=Serendipita vermifera MAFF 305830 TaxID=933852 RepID=A0A0C2WPK9_SERVB|nr:hypothetical protein M408DRAFT_334341 [Serendipita vermifera MAFF 305830]